MTCLNCFFTIEYQKELKKKTFEFSRFECRLEKYKELFLKELKNLEAVDKCICQNITNIYQTNEYGYANYVDYTNNYVEFIKKHYSELNNFFDKIIATYKLFITKSYKHGTDKFWSILEDYNLINSERDSLFNEKLLYRARQKNELREQYSKYDFFHIPFDKRFLISNQRFSIAGQPVLYYGSSILTVCRELETIPEELAIAAFVPSFNVIKKSIMFIP